MRRLLLSLAVLSLLGTGVVGCRHVAGVCDCIPDSNCGHAAPAIAPVAHHTDGHPAHDVVVPYGAPVSQEPPTLTTPRTLPGAPGKAAH